MKFPKIYLRDSGVLHTLLGLQRLDVIHAGDRTFPLSARIRAVALRRADPDLTRLA